MSDLEFAVWFAAAADTGWAPLDGDRHVEDLALGRLAPGRQSPSEVVLSLARSASAMHDAMLTLAFSDEERLDATGTAEATLARAALESLATGLWLMLPDEAVLRLRRYISLMVTDTDDMLRFGDALSGVEHESAWVGFPSKALRVSTSATAIIKDVDRAMGTAYLLRWQLYSGLAHGRPWASQAWRSQAGDSPTAGEQAGRVLLMVGETIGLARRFLAVADLRRRFDHRTPLEEERLQRIRQMGGRGPSY